MAYTKIKPIKSRLDRCVNYALNDEKTDLSNALSYAFNPEKTANEHVLYESAINCVKATAFNDIIATKTTFNKSDGVLGYHIMQSFKPNETTPEEAHAIGQQFANKCFGDRYEVIIATHLDRHHLHNHIVINSVSFVDGKKYRNSFSDYFGDIRGISDRICKEHGLSIIQPTPDHANQSISYADWLAQKKGKMSWHSIIRIDIDDAVKEAFNYGNFLMLMQEKGYVIKQGKYLSLKPYNKERFSRTYKLGEAYTENAIKNRILGKDLEKELPHLQHYIKTKRNYQPNNKPKGFRALCFHYLYLLGTIKKNQAPEKVSFLLKEDLIKFEAMTQTFNFLKDRNLNTYDDVINYKANCEETIQLLKADQLAHKQELAKKNILFHSLTDLSQYKEAHELYLNGYLAMEDEHKKYLKAKKFLKKSGYSTTKEIESLRQEYSLHLERASKVNGDIRHFKHESRMYDKAIACDEHIRKQMKKVEQLEEPKSNEKVRSKNEPRW